MTPFHETVPTELNRVQARRNAVLGETAPTIDAAGGATEERIAAGRDRAKRMDLFGVCFSGGGIRSATFCLGVLQALGKLGLLKRVDYLSTVSGGGYIGGWLAAWIRRETDGLKEETGAECVRNVERQLDPDRTNQARSHRRGDDDPASFRSPFAEDAEPSPIHHLRAHSRYLAPATGPLSLDGWVLFAIYIRNLAVNSLIAVPLLACFVFAVRFAVYGFAQSARNETFQGVTAAGFLGILLIIRAIFDRCLSGVRTPQKAEFAANPWVYRGFFLLLPVAAYFGMFLLAPVQSGGIVEAATPSRMPEFLRTGQAGSISDAIARSLGASSSYAQGVLLFAGLASLALFVAALFRVRKLFRAGNSVSAAFAGIFLIVSAVAAALAFAAPAPDAWSIAVAIVAFAGFLAWLVPVGDRLLLKSAIVRIGTTYAYAAVLGLLASVIVNEFLYAGPHRPAAFAAFAPPLFLLAMWVAGFVEVALAGGWFSDEEREWRSRFGAWLLLLAVGWLAIFGTVIYLPQWLDNTGGTATVAVVGALSAAVRYLVPRLAKSPGLMTWFAVRVVPILFLIALLALVATGVDRLIARLDAPERVYQAAVGAPAGSALEWTYAARLENNGAAPLGVGLGGALVLFLTFVTVVPSNRFSLHTLYANRLIRAYLGASRRTAEDYKGIFAIPTAAAETRAADVFSKFDPDDDLPLLSLGAGYLGPYPIFNTTLNLVSGSDLAYQDRRGESFALTPDYCGSESTEYARLVAPAPGDLRNLTVGRAITISGAAVDANMANYYSPQFTAFLTLLNARLGWWLQNPADAEPWTARAPVGSWHYIKEMLGDTDAKQPFVHLSDGGHYENTGAYELIRRRCRFVILVDAAENPDNTSENLANLVRVVHSDFGIRIAIDTTPLKRTQDGFSKWHCAVGAIRYDDVDAGGVIGTLLFIRASLTGDEPADIKNYASVVPVFPHHPTYDQFFDEAQFESYRGLGYHIGMSVLAEAADSTKSHTPSSGDFFHRRLFAKLRRTWTPSTAAQSTQYVESCRDFLRQINGSDDRLHDRELAAKFAELQRTAGALPTALFGSTDGGEFREQLQRAQLMEMAWLMNDLERSYSHPIQRGWVNTMRSWTAAEPFQKAWPEMRTCFSQGFVRFCERALNVNQPSVHLAAIPPGAQAMPGEWDEMIAEFQQEHGGYLRGHNTNAAEYLMSIRAEATGRFSIIGYGAPHTGDSSGAAIGDIQHIVGFAAIVRPLLTPHGTAEELIVWIRGNYRMAGIGGVALRELKKSGAIAGPLFARFPRRGSGSAELLQRALWIQFMNDFDFYGLATSGPEPEPWERTELRVGFGM